AMASSRAPSVLVVVSDGEDTCGANPCAAARAAKAAKPNLTINVIDLSDGNSGGVLQCIASAGGGRVFTPQSASQMNQAAQAATGQPDASGCP
ncbi:MAG: VWA domain-containing protein, partial [Rhodospirillaceae bacterium]